MTFRLYLVTCVLLFSLGTSSAEPHPSSHPSWWTYASPDATALVGIQWENLRQSPFAETVAKELSPTGGLEFPDLDCLKQARQIILSAPSNLSWMLGIEW